jgi:secreted trypsin-like serine protease
VAGDSGSGLICMNMQNNQYELFGLVSFGMSCGTEYSAGVYESLSFYRDWIELTLKCQFSE